MIRRHLVTRRILGLAACVLFAVPMIASWHSPGTPWILRLVALAIFGVTAVRPGFGLLFLAVVMPFGPYLSAPMRPAIDSQAVIELLLAPFLVATGLRLSLSRRQVSSHFAPAALLLGVIVAAAAVVELAAQQQATAFRDAFVADLGRHVWRSYLDDPAAFPSLHLAMGWLEGLALAVYAEIILQQDTRTSKWMIPALLVGATGAAATTWVRLVEISFRQVNPLSAAIHFLRELRINTLFRDVNAAGSIYAMYLVPALWLALSGAFRRPVASEPLAQGAQSTISRAPGAVKSLANWYWLPVAIISLALWLTHSRAAVAAPIASVGGLWFFAKRRSKAMLVVGGTLGIVLLLGLILISPAQTGQSSSAGSSFVRLRMAHIAFQITAAHPWFGIGLGQFQGASQAFMTSDFIARFPPARVGENAHNNFLQILAELGIVGLFAFVWLIAEPARSAFRAGQAAMGRPAFLAVTGGVLSFLLTCVLGHPLLIVQVVLLFMLVLGAAGGLGPTVAMGGPWRGRLVAALALIVVASLPFRISARLRTADLDHVVIGADRPSGRDDTRIYRIAEARSRWFVTARARVLEIPLRLTDDSELPCVVRIQVDGRPANALDPVRDEWRTLTMEFRPSGGDPLSRQIDLMVEGPRCHLKVGSLVTRE